ncbi:MAG: hypothetical protein ACKOAY_09480 [Haliscomenobacter sp.]
MDGQLYNLQRKSDRYKDILQNTGAYRQVWQDTLRESIKQTLTRICSETGLEAPIELRAEIENLEAVVLTMGNTASGLRQVLGQGFKRDLLKHNGDLVYQQLFNGKILVLINYPFIENYGEPRPPKTIAIYRPHELQDAFFIRHVEEWLQELIDWEDYDDDEPIKRIGFNFSGGKKSEAGSLSLETEVK